MTQKLMPLSRPRVKAVLSQTQIGRRRRLRREVAGDRKTKQLLASAQTVLASADIHRMRVTGLHSKERSLCRS